MPRTSRGMTAAERQPPLHEMTSVLHPIALQAQERGLARSARADQKVKAAAREREIDVPQHLVTGAVTHPDRLQPQDGRAILVHQSTPPLAGPRREVCTDARMRLGGLQPKG